MDLLLVSFDREHTYLFGTLFKEDILMALF